MTDEKHPDGAGPDPGERLLAIRAADGDTAAVAELYDRYEKRLYNYCHRLTNNAEDAADATQEAFCNVIQRLPGLDTQTLNFGAYLYTAARNASLDIIKQSKRAVATEEVPEDRFATLHVEEDPERSLMTSAQQDAARAANARLPEKQREVLALREVAELSYDDIATTMEMNPNAVAQLISRARVNFFKQMRDASVVIPPLDETGERAIALAAARQDGQIAPDELDWLQQHLLTNEASRINVEAMHESTRIYRAIGPVAVVVALRNETIARAAELVSHKGKANASSKTEHVTAVQAGAVAGTPEASAAASNTGRRSTKRRILTTAGVMVFAAVTSLALVGGLSDNDLRLFDRASDVTESPESDVAGRTAAKDKDPSDSTDTNDPDADPNPSTGTPTKTNSDATKPDKRKKVQSKGESNGDSDPIPAPTPPEPTPEPPPATPPTPTPTGPTGRPPRPPINPPPIICRKPPCTPPPPIP
ncbi:MAG: sigma-70 family RNA polymerase sigma factor [Solirubrobacterales bacterium]